jgi:hypothetical protein
MVIQRLDGSLGWGRDNPLGARLGNAVVSYGWYLGELFWPKDLVVLYPQRGYWPLGTVMLAGGLLLGLSVLVGMGWRRHPYLLVGWLWYCGTLVPMSQIIQTGSHAMADRWTYLPSVGLLILAVWGGYELVQGKAEVRGQKSDVGDTPHATRIRLHNSSFILHPSLLWVAGGAAILACLPVTRQQLGYWKDGEILFRHTLEVTENNAIAHDGLGVALDNKGQIEEAISQFQECVRLKPTYARAHYNLGVAFFQRGRTDEAIQQFQEALHLEPNQAEAHNNLGAALGRKGQTDAAIRQFQEALRLKPDHAVARKNLNALLATNAPASPQPGGSPKP